MSPRNLIELISEVRPQSALFTTYTLSLGFIESALLPTLRQAGCKEVAILADADELDSSLVEAQAQGVGRQYRIAALTAPGGGVFHPKLAYLVCKDQDILAVGSGNLTASGLHRQLECLDAVSSRDYPAVFADLANFAGRLAQLVDGTSKQGVAVLRLLERRARLACTTTSRLSMTQQSTVRLVHTLDDTASSQIVDLWNGQGTQADSLLVLAPFHTRDGSPVRRLGKALAAHRLEFGLDPVTKIAPLEKPRKAEKAGAAPTFSFVVPELDLEPRRLHAKLFEVRAKNTCLIVSGSINATQTSLESKDNVEVSLARVLPKSPFKWTPCKPEDFVPNNYEPSAREVGFAYMDATLSIDGTVEGSVWGVPELPSSALATLEDGPEQELIPRTMVALNAQGQFSFRLPKRLETDSPVQLTLKGAGIDARCWLSVEEDLSATDEQRREKLAVRHLLAGDFANDDVLELLQMFTRAAIPPHPQGGAPSRGQGGLRAAGPQPSDEPFSFAPWQYGGARSRSGIPGGSTHDVLRAYFRWLNSDEPVPVKQPAVVDAPPPPAASKGVARPTPTVQQPATTPEDLEELLQTLLAGIPAILRDNPGLATGPLLALVAGARALKLALKATWGDDKDYQGLRHWLEVYSGFRYAQDEYQSLKNFALGTACLIIAMANQRNRQAPRTVLKDFLLRLSGDWRVSAPNRHEVNLAFQDYAFARVSAGLKAAAVQSIDELWQAKPLDQCIEDLVKNALEPAYQASLEDEASFPQAVAAVRSIRRVNPKLRDSGLLQTERELDSCGCPHCYRAFSTNLRDKLKSNHLVVCPNSMCRKAIFHFADEHIAQRVKERLANA